MKADYLHAGAVQDLLIYQLHIPPPLSSPLADDAFFHHHHGDASSTNPSASLRSKSGRGQRILKSKGP